MSTFKDTISYLKPIVMQYKWQFFLIFFLQAGRLVFNSIINPLIYKRIIDVISKSGVDRSLVAHSLLQNVFFIVILLPIGWFFGRATQFAMSKFQSLVIKDLHDFSFKKLHDHSYMFFADHFSGALVNKSRKFVRAFEVMHDILIDNFWNSLVALTAVFVVFFTQSHMIAFIFLGMAVFYLSIVFLMARKKVEYDLAEAAADSKVTAVLADSITNFLSIKSSSSIDREVKSFKETTNLDEKLRLRTWYFGNKLNAIQSGISFAVQMIVAFVTAYLWLDGKISAGVFVLVQSYSVTIGNQFWDLGKATTKFTKSMSDMKEMVDIFKQTSDVVDPSDPEVSRIQNGNIEIKNIDFIYPNGTDVFTNFSLKINKGERVGLVGHSGSGKSTFTKLIMRFIDISSGEILIDGQDIRKIKQDDLRNNISYISQEPILFHRSIRENIAYSLPEATEEQIIEAAKKAYAHEFIVNLKHGYDTMVGERGVKLSGGQRQRVSIARAMLKPTPIIMLDEATSSLDSVSEKYIQDAFNKLTKGKTTIVIAHRLSTIQKMDRIIVLEKGKIAEEGTHMELLKKEGIYANLWGHQTGGFL
ncbi:MAG: ABC transporter ATP-binding protein [Patescibacteria group bacterium]